VFILGLTGSIGMGKSTTAKFFAEEGIPVHDADAAVHRLYEGEAVAAIEAAFPGSTEDGRVDRTRLAARVLSDESARKRLEAIVHPLVRESEKRFLADASARQAPIVLLDIPLLYETGAERRVDAVVVVSAPAEVQWKRVMSRPGMTAERFAGLLAAQVPDEEKRRRADFIVDTSGGFDAARAQVRDILASVAKMPAKKR
jgi:dephospho-CoA kinase